MKLLEAKSLVAVSLLGHSLAFQFQWPFNRHSADSAHIPSVKADTLSRNDQPDQFAGWLQNMIHKDHLGQFRGLFKNSTMPDSAKSVQELFSHIEVPDPASWDEKKRQGLPTASSVEAHEVFSHLDFPMDPRCIENRTTWWYRTHDGSCNWLMLGESDQGQVGKALVRDYRQYSYADGISKPREGPNARAVSNAFFKRKERLYYEHTPILVGLIEFVIHDITYSRDSPTEIIEVGMPPDEVDFPLNTTLRVKRTAAVEGTGTSKENPREPNNMASTWLDVSSLYGSSTEVANKLRSFKGGKLITQEVVTRGRKEPSSYLPFNTMGVPTNSRPGIDEGALFAGGDARTNEDWMMLAVHTLVLREHNRLCDIVAQKHPEYNDEQLYQTVRVVMSAKYQLIANAYQMAYWSETMPWPRDDGFSLYRQMYGANFLEINPANTYPWPLVTKNKKPMVASAEMAVVYRFHEFIIPTFPIIDEANQTLWDQGVIETGFNAKGFIDAGLENILRGLASVTIPNFKSGVDESFRSANKYRGVPFDLATWSKHFISSMILLSKLRVLIIPPGIVHEREQGLPTFNQYFRAYNAEGGSKPNSIENCNEKGTILTSS
jgi:peroxidase